MDELAYPGTPIAAALSLFEGIDETAAGLDRITCPVLLLSSREDHVVPPSSGDVLEAGVAGPVERVWLEHSYHVATLDYDAERLVHGPRVPRDVWRGRGGGAVPSGRRPAP